jgi:hypothetical protein
MTAQIHTFAVYQRPDPDMITSDADGKLAAALKVSDRVFSGEDVSLPTMIVAREVIDSHTRAKAVVRLLDSYIDDARVKAAMAPQETLADVWRRHADRWPEIAAWAVVGAAVICAATGWGW